jgi:hypothetical protein
MKKRLFLVLVLLSVFQAHAQLRAKKYLSSITRELSEVETARQTYLAVFVAYADPVVIETRRQELLQRTARAVQKASKMNPFRGSNALRDSFLVYLGFTYACASEDFVAIADMESIADLSYDAMESYLLARDNAFRGAAIAAANLNHCIRHFATSHRMLLEESPGQVQEINSRVSYYNSIYEVFFQSYKQEAYLLEAIGQQDVSAVEQNRKALLSSSVEGLRRLRTMALNEGPTALTQACADLLVFYNQEAVALSDAAGFFANSENFNRLKKAFLSVPPDEQSSERAEVFRDSLKEVSEQGIVFGGVLQELETRRGELMESWNANCRQFIAGGGQ